MCKEESSKSDDLGEVLRAMFKMHPFIIALTITLSIFFGIVYRSGLFLVTKLTILGAGVLLQVLAISFEAYRIDREEKLRDYALKKGVILKN